MTVPGIEDLGPRPGSGSVPASLPGRPDQIGVERKGEGLHHIRFAVDDHDAVRDGLRDRGVEVCQAGDSVRGGGVRYAYYDTVPMLGFLTETLDIGRAAS